MNKINVYDFCTMFFKCKEIILHVWTIHEDETETCEHKKTTDKYSLYEYKDAEVTQFNCLKKGTIDIIAIRDHRKK